MRIGEWGHGRSAVIAGTAALSLLAVAGMAVPVPLFYGVDFVFGSVAVMLAVPLFGTLPAVVVALAGGLFTLPLWEHPYALVTFVAEGGFVATLYQRGWRNLVLADLTYWLLLGAPLVLAFYGGALGMPWQAVSLIALKQPLNAVFNALLAGLVLIGAGLLRRAPERRYMGTTELSAILFHVMVGLIFLAGAVPIIQHGHSARAHEEDALFWRLHDRAEETAAHLAARPAEGPGYWASLLAEERTRREFGLGLLDAEGHLLAREGELQELAANPVRQQTTVAGLGHWAPAHISNPMQRWKGGRYRVTVDLAGHPRVARVVAEQAAAPLVTRLESRSSTRFVFLAALFALAIVVARLLSRALTRPVMRLSRVASATTNGIVITDVDGRVEWINDAFSRMSGYTLGEMRGKKPGDLLQDADTDPAAVARMRDALAQGQDFEAELLNQTKHGAAYWVHISCNALHGDDGKQQGYMAVETDVTERRRFEAALQRERQRLADIIWGTNAGTWEWNVQTGETCFNERWAEIIGYTLAELEPVSIATWSDHAHPDDLARSDAALRRHLQGETDAYECEARMRHKDGRWVWVLDRGRVTSYTADGEPLWVSGTHVDITIRKEAQLRVDELLSQLQKLVTKIPGVVYQYQQWPDGRAAFPYASEGLRDIYGIRPQDVIEDASLVFDAVHPEDRPRVAASIDESFRSLSTWHEHYRSVLPDGRTVWLDGQAEPEPMPDGSVLWHGYIRDVTALKEYQHRLERIAHYDPVTGLANRALLGDRLHSAMANADRRENYIAVVYLDLDGFKAVNDTHGHSQGDALLEVIGHKIMTCLRETDTAARIGGDEFAIVLTDLPEPQASAPVIDRLLRLLAEPVSLSSALVRVSASAGVTFYPQVEPVEADQLVRQADQAMYTVKRSGKNGCRVFNGTTPPETGSVSS